jgi:hypothetical protein
MSFAAVASQVKPDDLFIPFLRNSSNRFCPVVLVDRAGNCIRPVRINIERGIATNLGYGGGVGNYNRYPRGWPPKAAGQTSARKESKNGCH